MQTNYGSHWEEDKTASEIACCFIDDADWGDKSLHATIKPSVLTGKREQEKFGTFKRCPVRNIMRISMVVFSVVFQVTAF